MNLYQGMCRNTDFQIHHNFHLNNPMSVLEILRSVFSVFCEDFCKIRFVVHPLTSGTASLQTLRSGNMFLSNERLYSSSLYHQAKKQTKTKANLLSNKSFKIAVVNVIPLVESIWNQIKIGIESNQDLWITSDGEITPQHLSILAVVCAYNSLPFLPVICELWR